MATESEIREFIHLATEKITKEDATIYPTVDDVKERLAQILGRPIWTHELAYPKYLIAELLGDESYSSFQQATAELAKRMPTIIVSKEA